MTKASKRNLFIPKNKEIQKIMDQLIKYPVYKVNDKKITQSFGRITWTRNQKRKKNIYIKDGVVSLPYKVVLKKNGKGFEIKYR